MPVPSAITDLSQTAGSNYPSGGESPITADNYFQAYASFIALLRDGKGFSTQTTLASATTTDIGGQNSPFVSVTGTTTITGFGTNYTGPRFVSFTGTQLPSLYRALQISPRRRGMRASSFPSLAGGKSSVMTSTVGFLLLPRVLPPLVPITILHHLLRWRLFPLL